MSADRWVTDWVPEHNAAYVRPIGDLIDHPESHLCECGPTVEPCPRPDGRALGWLVTHHSLDGREAAETTTTTKEN